MVGSKKYLFPQRARAARPKAAMPAKALTPTMEPADLEELAAGAEELVLVDAALVEAEAEETGLVAVAAVAGAELVAGEEPEALEDVVVAAAVVAAAVVADPVGRLLNVTP